MNYIGQNLTALLLSALLILAFNRIILTDGVRDFLKPNAKIVVRLAFLLVISLIVILGLSSSLMYPSQLQGYMQDFLIALVFVLSFAAMNLAVTRSHALGHIIDQLAIWLANLLSRVVSQLYRPVIVQFFSAPIRAKFLNWLMTYDTRNLYKDLVRSEYDVLGISLQAKAMELYNISSPLLSDGYVDDYFLALTSRSLIIHRQQKSVSAQEFLREMFGSLGSLYTDDKDYEANR